MNRDKYVIVKAEWPGESPEKLQEKVNEKISEGYEPIGGMTTWKDDLNRRVFTQAMELKVRIL